jgi:hypothetical protein
MTSKKLIIEKLMEKFPDQANLICELFEESDSFRSVCEDYMECRQVIERLKYVTTMAEQGYLQEYKILFEELEDEIAHRITG